MPRKISEAAVKRRMDAFIDVKLVFDCLQTPRLRAAYRARKRLKPFLPTILHEQALGQLIAIREARDE